MNIQTIVNEKKRGCGYRKEGGLYLIAGTPSAPCGKLPLPLGICPCCHAGIKPARAWTWINSKMLFAGVPCRDPECSSGWSCILADHNLPERMGLLWVGEKFYPTAGAFLEEGMVQGVSRRISAIPHDFQIGQTWVLFAHRKGVPTKDLYAEPAIGNQDWQAAIIGCFLPERIEYIVREDDPSEKLEAMERRGISLIKLVRTDDGNGNGLLHVDDEEEMA